MKQELQRKKKGLGRKCVGYSDESGMYGLCKTYAWASEFPDLLSSSLSRRGGGGRSQLFLAFVKILLFAFTSTSGRLSEVVPQA